METSSTSNPDLPATPQSSYD